MTLAEYVEAAKRVDPHLPWPANLKKAVLGFISEFGEVLRLHPR